jgi:hypothetical protein
VPRTCSHFLCFDELIHPCFRCSQVIQADFVERRQKSVGGEGMTQEDLLFRMTAAR